MLHEVSYSDEYFDYGFGVATSRLLVPTFWTILLSVFGITELCRSSVDELPYSFVLQEY